MDAKQNISSIRHFLRKRNWVSVRFGKLLTRCFQVMVHLSGCSLVICFFQAGKDAII